MKPRVLHVITVYNGRSFVPQALNSAVGMSCDDAEIDILVLDDASPERGFSKYIAQMCDHLGVQYYRTPRNLGIPRNVSLGMATAVRKGYDYVTINNSDVIFPKNLITILLAAARRDKKIGSVTAWSNNVSIFFLPNSDPDRYLRNGLVVDDISDAMCEKFSESVIDIPAGISFCILMPVEVIRDVGLMDPIFGRGYCEETDWSLRSLRMGYRICLGLGSFVYHQGRGSNLAAGLVSGAHTTVPENEVIIDSRYPDFRRQCDEFIQSDVMGRYRGLAIDHLLERAAGKNGFSVMPDWMSGDSAAGSGEMIIKVITEGSAPVVKYSWLGFEQIWPLTGADMINAAVARFGVENLKNNHFAMSDGGSLSYPVSVW